MDLASFLRPPTLDTPERTERAAILWFTLLLGIAVCGVQAVTYLLVPTMQDSALVLLPELVGFAAALAAVRRGWLVAPAAALVFVVTATGTAFTFFGGGGDLGFPAFLGTVAVMGALMLGARVGAALTAWAVACAVGVFVVGADDRLLIPGQDPRAIALTVQVITVLLGGSLVTYSVHRLSVALRAEREQTAAAERAAASLERARRFTEDVVRSMAEGVLLSRPDGAVLQANDAARRLFGAALPEQLVGATLSALFSADDLARLEGAATPGSTAFGEAIVRRPDGTEVPVRLARSPIRGEDGELLHVLVLSDVSHQVEAQRRSAEAARAAEESNRAKSQFLANMSHELRTPLNAVIGYADMLLDDLDDADHAADVERIRQAGQHLLTLINDVLDMSKIEAGRMDVYLEPVSVPEVVREVEAAVQPTAARRRNTLAVEVGEGVASLYTDARKLRQILLNLVSNAVKFTEGGEVSIRVRGEGDQLLVEVRDTGIGIAPEAMARLFRPFTQADDSTSRKYGGTGLGLALSLRFAEMLGGTLTARSTPGEGSTFTLTLPARKAAAHSPGPAIDGGEAPLVLCVDDDPSMLDLLGRTLRRQGLRVAQAASGADALAVARAHHPAVITLDVMMPEMDGWTLLRRLRADAGLRDVPVVMVSMVDHDVGAAVALGAADYLSKPVEPDQLVATVRRYLATGAGRVLVVDDEEVLRDLLARALRAEGWEVAAAPDAGVALELLPGFAPDLVVLDLMMPGMDGFTFVDRVRADDRWRALPIVVLTAMDLTREQWADLSERTSRVVPKGQNGLHRVLHEVRRFARGRAA